VQDIEGPESTREPPIAAPGERLRARFGFTKTEARVVGALVEGLSYGEIAETLGVSYHTVHTHIKAIHQKAGISTTGRLTALVRSALEHK
jgi:DNA-binding CsgD family transcriptional regulator